MKSIYPKNKQKFIRLEEFCKEIIDICNKLNAEPILYGSLAIFAYKKDKTLNVNDIDLLIPESLFNKIIPILKKGKIRHNYSKKWHTLQIFKNNLKIELDSIEFWQKRLPKTPQYFNFGEFKIRIVSLNTLKKIYKKASEVSKDNPEGNRKKFEMLNSI